MRNASFFLLPLLLFSCAVLPGFKAEEEPPDRLAQTLAEGKHKRQRGPTGSAEGEAQSQPWAQEIWNCTITYYDICELCCGKADGITYSGALAVPYETCAVDPDVIPLGSTVMVDFGDDLIHAYRAEDIGGGVIGNHIDICVASHDEAMKLGIMEATVYWIYMEEAFP